MKRTTLSICIPAFNEEENISLLLADIFRQRTTKVKMKEVLIASDGSVDRTVAKIESYSRKKIKIVRGVTRKGIAFRQNQLFSKASGDICVLLNADIRITDPYFLEKLTKPIIKQKAHLTSADIRELPSRTWFEEVLSVSMRIKAILFRTWKKGNNVYTCHGPARAFSKNLYKEIKFYTDRGEDMYSYLFSIVHGYTYLFVSNTYVYYQLPSTFSDHIKQSIRYISAKHDYLEIFPNAFVAEEITIPPNVFIKAGVEAFQFTILHLPATLMYLCTLFVVYCVNFTQKQQNENWDVISSKTLQLKI